MAGLHSSGVSRKRFALDFCSLAGTILTVVSTVKARISAFGVEAARHGRKQG